MKLMTQVLLFLYPWYSNENPEIIFHNIETVFSSLGNTVIPTEEFLFDGHPVHDHHNCGSVEQENVELRRKLEKTRRAFEKTWAQLRLSNQRKEQIEKDIRHEIYKTHNVLKNVRSNIENVNNEEEVKTS